MIPRVGVDISAATAQDSTNVQQKQQGNLDYTENFSLSTPSDLVKTEKSESLQYYTGTLASRRDLSSPSGRQARIPSRVRRTSFASVEEEPINVPQSFLDTAHRADASLRLCENYMSASVLPPIHHPNECCPCVAFQLWKRHPLNGGRQSKSSPNLTGLVGYSTGSISDTSRKESNKQRPKVQRDSAVGLEAMPVEILDQILSHLVQQISPESYGPRNLDLISCLTSSKTVYPAAINILYRNVTIPHSRTFSKLMSQLRQHPALGALVRRLDFSHYTSIGFGLSRRASSEIQNVTPQTLQQCVELMPNLKEFQVHEHVDDELDEEVFRKLFLTLSLHALDLTACSSRTFVKGFTNAVVHDQHLSTSLPVLRRLCLHECSTLQAPVFEALLPLLHNLTHLDVTHTLITDEALFSIPHAARLTHLNLSRCTRITGPSTVKFLTTHSAVKNSLIYLNLMTNASRQGLLSANDLQKLIPFLPATLRSLNVGGSMITKDHLRQLLPLTKHLEELGLAQADLSEADVNSLFAPRSANADNDWSFSGDKSWTPSALRYLDLMDVPAVTQMSLFSSSCVLATPHSFPLEVVELGDGVIRTLRQSRKSAEQLGWVVKELGRRGWFVRIPSDDGLDDGRRTWKMGARWWGMRKVPVAVQEVGGMYGHYMFKN